MRLSREMMWWLLRVYRGEVSLWIEIPTVTRRALQRRLLLARHPDTLRPILTHDGHVFACGVVAARRLRGEICA